MLSLVVALVPAFVVVVLVILPLVEPAMPLLPTDPPTAPVFVVVPLPRFVVVLLFVVGKGLATVLFDPLESTAGVSPTVLPELEPPPEHAANARPSAERPMKKRIDIPK